MQFFFDILPTLLKGAQNTVLLTFLSAILALLIGFGVGFARLSDSKWISVPVRIYVEIFRNTSSLVQIFYFFFVLPLVGIRLDAFTTGTLVLGLNFGAYLSEVVRSSILAVHKGQHEASIALGIPLVKRYRRIILPQAIVIMLPAFGNYALELLKSTSLVSLITITELTFSGAQLVQLYGNATTIYSAVFLLYLLMALPLIALNSYLERRSGGQWRSKEPII